MAILADEKTRVLVQGITGRAAGRIVTNMLNYGTKLVAGVTPGRGGQEVLGVPVYDTVEEAVEKAGPIDATFISVPPFLAKVAAFEAMDAGVKLVCVYPDHVPKQDTMEVAAYAKKMGSRAIGPNSAGIISPGKCVISGFRTDMFKPGPVCILSRSGGMTSTLANDLTKIGVGQSTCISIGGDPVICSDLAELSLIAEKDEETKAIAVFGEIGTTQEERLAELIKQGKVTKPVFVYIAGATAPQGMRFSHAGAIIERGRGSGESKIKALRNAGAYVVESYSALARKAKEILGGETS